jgi:hypothetical protein
MTSTTCRSSHRVRHGTRLDVPVTNTRNLQREQAGARSAHRFKSVRKQLRHRRARISNDHHVGGEGARHGHAGGPPAGLSGTPAPVVVPKGTRAYAWGPGSTPTLCRSLKERPQPTRHARANPRVPPFAIVPVRSSTDALPAVTSSARLDRALQTTPRTVLHPATPAGWPIGRSRRRDRARGGRSTDARRS